MEAGLLLAWIASGAGAGVLYVLAAERTDAISW